MVNLHDKQAQANLASSLIEKFNLRQGKVRERGRENYNDEEVGEEAIDSANSLPSLPVLLHSLSL